MTAKKPAPKRASKAPSRTRDHQVGLPARRAAASLLDAVLQKKQPLDDVLGRAQDGGYMFDLPARDRALARAIVGTSLRRKGQIDAVLAKAKTPVLFWCAASRRLTEPVMLTSE